jgi:glycerophosphoryl diester phosphodiesterase
MFPLTFSMTKIQKMMIFPVLLLSLLTSISCASNIGHRVGAGHRGYYKALPENSIVALKAALIGFDHYAPLQDRSDFIYVEFDLQETADGEIVLFHDKGFKRMLPNNSINRDAIELILSEPATIKRMKGKNNYKNLQIKHLTLKQIQTLILAQTTTERVPTLQYFLQKSLQWNIKKPMTFEIKYFQTHATRLKLIKLVKEYKNIYITQQDIKFENKFDMDKSGISFLAFKRNLKKSFPLKKWCPIFKENGFGSVFRPITHSNLCR